MSTVSEQFLEMWVVPAGAGLELFVFTTRAESAILELSNTCGIRYITFNTI